MSKTGCLDGARAWGQAGDGGRGGRGWAGQAVRPFLALLPLLHYFSPRAVFSSFGLETSDSLFTAAPTMPSSDRRYFLSTGTDTSTARVHTRRAAYEAKTHIKVEAGSLVRCYGEYTLLILILSLPGVGVHHEVNPSDYISPHPVCGRTQASAQIDTTTPTTKYIPRIRE